VLHGLALIYVLRDMPGVQGFKIVQHSTQRTEVMIVPAPSFDHSDAEAVVAGLKRRLGQTVQVDVALVDRIASERSGKFRYVVSHCAAPTA
jgi:phenylacetate-CoA ligase